MCLPTVKKVNMKTKSAERKIFLTSYCTVSGLVLHWLILDSVQFSHSVVSASLWPHEPQRTRPPCPSATPGVYPNPRPLSRWCHPTISSSIIPFSSCPQSFPAWGSFQMSQLFTLGGQSIGVSVSWSVLSMNTEDWSPLGWTGWSPCSPRDSQESSPTLQFKSISSSVLSFLYQRRQWQPTPVLLPGKSHGWRSLVGCSLWGG